MWRSLVIVIALGTAARADVDHVGAARDAYAKGDFAVARDELIAAYAADPRPEYLFALGQAEFNLGSYQDAIDYYEKFTATNPSAEQAALAQQAIGAARARLDQPPPPKPVEPVAPPPPPKPITYHRAWDGLDWTLGAGGAALLAIGASGLVYADVHSTDRSGTLHSYDARIHTSKVVEIAGIGALGLGAASAVLALVHWRVHLEPDATITVGVGSVGVEVAW
jgi:tetratricopeptide (TPR) repeat protein